MIVKRFHVNVVVLQMQSEKPQSAANKGVLIDKKTVILVSRTFLLSI